MAPYFISDHLFLLLSTIAEATLLIHRNEKLRIMTLFSYAYL
ncbi:Putative protein [Zobellia galactanivorans]|uniref:Uncharacterized protein n=1 Tax=Zobellia galactanivorans (strain DSM 12802 / CCUG 47099 / CIP 106680 / NCIMB 13871 / Dsij) TaxID=63186 RepID=G0L465_ZOBGA|nr:Putative protein [Zobellia galactanivorans]